MSKAWVTAEWIDGAGHRRREQVNGSHAIPDGAAFVVEWIDPDGHRRREKIDPSLRGNVARRLAMNKADEITASLISGTYNDKDNRTWSEFREWYDRDVWATIDRDPTKREIKYILDRFERIAKPQKLRSVNAAMLVEYRTARLKEGDVVPATINKDVRHIVGILSVGKHIKDWVKDVPKLKPLREDHTNKPFVSVEHFEAIYGACDAAKLPVGLPYEPADWWRALLVTMWSTGQRIGSFLRLEWRDVHLDDDPPWLLWAARSTKGRRDKIAVLEPEAVEHLRRVRSFEELVFPWPYDRTTLQNHLKRIQQASGIRIDGATCYGFHAIRRAYATLNDHLDLNQLQNQMGHQSPMTTQRYINYAERVSRKAPKSKMPDFLKVAAQG